MYLKQIMEGLFFGTIRNSYQKKLPWTMSLTVLEPVSNKGYLLSTLIRLIGINLFSFLKIA